MSILVASLLSAAVVFLAISFAVLASAIWQARAGEEDDSGYGPVASREPASAAERFELTGTDCWHTRISSDAIRTRDSSLAMSVPRRSASTSHRPACRRSTSPRETDRA